MKSKRAETQEIVDEPGMAERFQRGLQRAFQTPHKPIMAKRKGRAIRKRRIRKSEAEG